MHSAPLSSSLLVTPCPDFVERRDVDGPEDRRRDVEETEDRRRDVEGSEDG